MTAFISDLHLGHAQVLEHDSRPFPTIEAHDTTLLSNLSALPTATDLWVLGDVAFTPARLEDFFEATRHLRVHLVRGNHDDKLAWKRRERFHAAYEAAYLRTSIASGEKVRLYLSHYAHRTWRNSHHGSYHLFGHSHGALPPLGRSMDVGANVLNYRPITLEAVHVALKDLPCTNHHASS